MMCNDSTQTSMEKGGSVPLSWPGNAHWLTDFIIFYAALWGLQRKKNIFICQRAHFYFDFFFFLSNHEWGISSCSNLMWKELTVFARELGGREGNLSIQPRLPTAVKRIGSVNNINFMVHYYYSCSSFQLRIWKQIFRLWGKEDAPDQAASSEQLTGFPPSPLLAWSISEERNLLACRHINQESFSCWKLQQCHTTDLQGKKKKQTKTPIQLVQQGEI